MRNERLGTRVLYAVAGPSDNSSSGKYLVVISRSEEGNAHGKDGGTKEIRQSCGEARLRVTESLDKVTIVTC